MSNTEKPGATGKFPQGKISRSDEGELKLGIKHDSYGNIHINFGKTIAWIAMPPEQAIKFARLLLKHCGATKIEITIGNDTLRNLNDTT